MSARSELLTGGRLGEEGAALLYDTVGLVGVAHRFPPPDGSTSWDEAAQQTVAHDFLESPRAATRLLDLAVRSVDDRSFERLLEKSVLNHLRDVARSTDLGKLIVRVKDVLRGTSVFVAVPSVCEDRWIVTGSTTASSTTPARDLAEAIRGEVIATPRWTSSTRDAPLADRDSFIRLIRLVLLAAYGSLTARDIAAVLITRLDHRRVPLVVELDTAEGLSEPADPAADPASQAASKLRAVEIFDSLSDRERIVVANLDLPVRELAVVIAIGKSQAAHLRQRLIDRMIAALEDDDDQQGTTGALAALCDHWLSKRTTNPDGTSE